jgi:DNA-directed RNA polymerase beta' subunit
MEKSEIDLKKAYSEIAKKHSLPDFEEIAEDFDIEKIQDKETSFLIREIRRAINEKIAAYIHLFENLINPTAPPMFIFSILRKMSKEDKEKIRKIYKALSRTQIEVIKLDTIYNEKNEAQFIKETFIIWQELKPVILKLIESFETSFDEDDSEKQDSYFA